MKNLSRIGSVAALAAVLGMVAPAAQAHGGWGGGWGGGYHGGWWGGYRGGVGVVIGVPYGYYGYPYPYAYYPPTYYAPPVYSPPVYAAPYAADPGPAYSSSAQAPAGYTCNAGPYVCPLSVVHAINGPCSCPANNGGRVYGNAR